MGFGSNPKVKYRAQQYKYAMCRILLMSIWEYCKVSISEYKAYLLEGQLIIQRSSLKLLQLIFRHILDILDNPDLKYSLDLSRMSSCQKRGNAACEGGGGIRRERWIIWAVFLL